jgi:hypothetical protein
MSSQIPTHSTGHRGRSTMRMSPLPMEWMDPMSWRLPSGKALAEFALQAGFLAPLMLSGSMKRKHTPQPMHEVQPLHEAGGKKLGEAPERSDSFRETR